MNDCQNISFVESETPKIVQYVSNNAFRARSFSFPPKQSTSSNQKLGIRPVWHHFSGKEVVSGFYGFTGTINDRSLTNQSARRI